MPSSIMCYVRLRRGWIKLFICNFNVYNSITILAEKPFKIAENSAKIYYRQNEQILMENSCWRDMNPCYTRYIEGSYFIYKSIYIEKKTYIIDIIIDIFLLIYNI